MILSHSLTSWLWTLDKIKSRANCSVFIFFFATYIIVDMWYRVCRYSFYFSLLLLLFAFKLWVECFRCAVYFLLLSTFLTCLCRLISFLFFSHTLYVFLFSLSQDCKWHCTMCCTVFWIGNKNWNTNARHFIASFTDWRMHNRRPKTWWESSLVYSL